AAILSLTFLGTQTLMGTGTVTFNGAVNDRSALVVGDGDTLTIAPGIIIHGKTGFIGSSSGGTFINQGTIAADGGGTITAQGVGNFSGGTLTGGTWQVSGGSTLRLIGVNIVTSAATISLDGGNLFSDGGTMNALASFATN